MFSLTDIEALSSGSASFITELSPTTVNIILAALDFISDPKNWTGASGTSNLTQAEIDRIDEITSLISDEVMP